MGVRSLRPTWFEDETVAKTTAEPVHGLRLIIKKDVLPISDYQKFEAIAEVASEASSRLKHGTAIARTSISKQR